MSAPHAVPSLAELRAASAAARPAEPERRRHAVANRFEFVDVEDYDDLPEEVWAVPGLIPAGPSNGLLFGLSGGGKTFLALDLALRWCGLGERRWFGREFRVPPSPVLYVLAEGGGRPFRERVDAWLAHNGHAATDLRERGFWLVDPKVRGRRLPQLTDDADMAEFADAILRREAEDGIARPGLVVLDTQRKLFGRGRKEDSADDASAMMENVERLSAALGAVLLTIAHPTKGARTPDGAEDPHSTPRGSGVYVDGSDFAIRTLKGEDRVWVAKQKSGEADYPLNFRVERVGGTPVYSTNLTREEQASRFSAAEARRMVVAARLALTGGGLRSDAKAALRRECSLQASDATGVLNQLADPAYRLFHLEGTGKAGSPYRLAPHDDLAEGLAGRLGPGWPDAPDTELDAALDELLSERVRGLGL